MLLTVSSLPALAFASFAMSRHPNIPRNPVRRGGLTRLQSLLHVTARQVCSPCTGQDFYSRAFTPFVAIGSVEYDYTGLQSIPAAGLAPARHAALWAASETKPNIWTSICHSPAGRSVNWKRPASPVTAVSTLPFREAVTDAPGIGWFADRTKPVYGAADRRPTNMKRNSAARCSMIKFNEVTVLPGLNVTETSRLHKIQKTQ